MVAWSGGIRHILEWKGEIVGSTEIPSSPLLYASEAREDEVLLLDYRLGLSVISVILGALEKWCQEPPAQCSGRYKGDIHWVRCCVLSC